MKIVLISHLKIRLEQRKIPQDYPKIIIQNPEKKFIDTRTGHYIAIKKMHYNQKIRSMMVAYDIITQEIQVVTIHPISRQEIGNKLKRERWIKYEKD